MHSTASPMIAQRRKAGLTLIELMVTVAIVGVLSVAMAPKIRRTVVEQRLSAGTRDVMRVFRDARAWAIGTRRATLVWVQPANLTIRTLYGRHNSCVAQDWGALDIQCSGNQGGRLSGRECKEFNLGDNYYSMTQTVVLTLVEQTGAGAVQNNRAVCYTPSGLAYFGSTLASNALSSSNSVNGGFLFELTMTRVALEKGETTAAVIGRRQVLVPLSGEARVSL